MGNEVRAHKIIRLSGVVTPNERHVQEVDGDFIYDVDNTYLLGAIASPMPWTLRVCLLQEALASFAEEKVEITIEETE